MLRRFAQTIIHNDWKYMSENPEFRRNLNVKMAYVGGAVGALGASALAGYLDDTSDGATDATTKRVATASFYGLMGGVAGLTIAPYPVLIVMIPVCTVAHRAGAMLKMEEKRE